MRKNERYIFFKDTRSARAPSAPRAFRSPRSAASPSTPR